MAACRSKKRQLLKNDAAIRELEPGTGAGTGTEHNLCKLSHFITAGDISDNIFQGGRIVSEEFVKISLLYKEQHSGIKSLVYTYALPKCLTKYYVEPTI